MSEKCHKQSHPRSLDQFVGGGDKFERKRKAEGVGGAEIDDEIEFR